MIPQFSIAWRFIGEVSEEQGIPAAWLYGPFTSPAIVSARGEVWRRMATHGVPVARIAAVVNYPVEVVRSETAKASQIYP